MLRNPQMKYYNKASIQNFKQHLRKSMVFLNGFIRIWVKFKTFKLIQAKIWAIISHKIKSKRTII